MYCPRCKRQCSAADGTAERSQSPTGEVSYACAECSSVLASHWMCGPCGDVEKIPVVGLNDRSQIVRQCNACGTPFGLALSAATAATGSAIEAGARNTALRPTEGVAPGSMFASVLRGDAGAAAAKPVLAKAPAHAATRTMVGAGPYRSAAALDEAPDIEGTIRARLAVVDAEIAARRGLETEARMLRKMLATVERVSASAAAKARMAAMLVPPAIASTDTPN